MKRILTTLAICLMIVGCTRDEEVAAGVVLEDGVYAVLDMAQNRGDLRAALAGEVVLVETLRFVRDGGGEPPNHVLLQQDRFVPLSLSRVPEKVTGDDGRDRIMIALDEAAAGRLAEFTREVSERQGQVVTVIGGEVVTRHKVRAPITGGAFAISC